MLGSERKIEILGRVASLHLHPTVPGAFMRHVADFEVVANRGIRGNDRYYDRRSRSTGLPNKRQVSLMEREVIAQHAASLELAEIAPGAVRANIETCGIELVPLIGRQLQIGEVILLLSEARTPCAKMDAICDGLRNLMGENRQGVLAEVLHSGRISEGDVIRIA
jgi:MOSC domain-containing protein YiiM